MHIASVSQWTDASVQSVPMARQSAGYWSATFKPPTPLRSGYFVFYFEDGEHHRDQNHGAYWDVVSCQDGEPSPVAIAQQSNTWLGGLMAPGMQRPLDWSKAIAILRDDLAHYPHHVGDYIQLWRDELAQGDGSPASYEHVGREIDEYLAKHGNTMPWS